MTELVVLAWGGPWDRALREAVSDPFEAHTGVRVTHERHVGLDLPAQLADGRGISPVSVVWCNSVAGMRAARAGRCLPLEPAEVPNLGGLHSLAKPAGFDGWPVVMVYAVAYVLVYRRSLFPDHPPDSWRVLLDERHRGRVALYPHGNGIHAVAQVLGGGTLDTIPGDMTACWRFLRALRTQVSTTEYSGGIVESLRNGALDLAFRALPNALGFQRAGLDVGWVAPREGVPDTLDCFWVPRGVPGEMVPRAMEYIDFALSEPVQRDWCARLGTVPVHRDSPAPPMLGTATRTPRTLDDHEHLLHIPEAVKVAHHDEWRQRFAALLAAPGQLT
ncbi:ABC transporter substrate-binding protein [Amycolatopsis lurida]